MKSFKSPVVAAWIVALPFTYALVIQELLSNGYFLNGPSLPNPLPDRCGLL